jgi:hypothetical protein
MQLGCSFACSWKSPEISVYLRKHRRDLQRFQLIRAKLRSTHKYYRLRSLLAIYLFRRLVYFIKEYLATPWRVAIKYCHFLGSTWPTQTRASSCLASSSHWNPGNEVVFFLIKRLGLGVRVREGFGIGLSYNNSILTIFTSYTAGHLVFDKPWAAAGHI